MELIAEFLPIMEIDWLQHVLIIVPFKRSISTNYSIKFL